MTDFLLHSTEIPVQKAYAIKSPKHYLPESKQFDESKACQNKQQTCLLKYLLGIISSHILYHTGATRKKNIT